MTVQDTLFILSANILKTLAQSVAVALLVATASFAQTPSVITTVAGNGDAVTLGDGGPAKAASVSRPAYVAFDPSGNLFIAGGAEKLVRKVNTAGVISTFATFGSAPYDIGTDGSGNVYVLGFLELFKVSPNGTVTTVPTTSAFSAYSADRILVDSAGTVYFSAQRSGQNSVLKLTSSGAATVVADGAGGRLAIDAAGNLYGVDRSLVSSGGGARIRKITPNGTITTIAGGGTASPGDGGPATAALLPNNPDIAIDRNGNLYLSGAGRIRRVSPSGIITTVAGTGEPGYSGDGGPPTLAQVTPYGLAVDAAGDLYFADNSNRIRKISNPTYVPPVSTPSPSGSTYSFSAGGGASLSTLGDSTALLAGYAKLQLAANTPLSGLEIFGFRQNNILVSEAAVPSAPRLLSGRIYAEIAGPVNTGLAIANPNNQTASVSFYFTDGNGQTSRQGSLTIPPNGQIANFLDQAPFSGGTSTRGTFTFSASVPVSAVALRGYTNERGEFLISTMPVADITVSSTDPLTFADYADGGGWTTQLLLINPSDTTITGSIQFSGAVSLAALPDSISTPRQPGQYDYALPPKSARRLVTTGTAAATSSGYVRVVPAAGMPAPAGVVVFSFRNNGVTVSEAGVPSVSASKAFRIYAETAGDFNTGRPGTMQTGVAIANLGTADAVVKFELTTITGDSTGMSGTITIGGGKQTATFLNQISGFEGIPSTFQGILRVSTTSSATLSVVGLRARFNERGDLLLATLPVTDENAPVSTTELIFPHFANGAGYTSQFILYGGTASASASANLTFVAQSGSVQTINTVTESNKVTATGTTDETGLATLSIAGETRTFRFIDQETRTGIPYLSVGVVMDIDAGYGLLMTIDAANKYPPRFLILEPRSRAPVGTSLESADGVYTKATTSPSGVIEFNLDSVLNTIIGKAYMDDLRKVPNPKSAYDDFKSLAGFVAKALNYADVPVGDYTDRFGISRTTNFQDPGEAIKDIAKDANDGIKQKVMTFITSGGTEIGEPLGVLVDIGSFIIDSTTVWGCSTANEQVSVTSFQVKENELWKLYNCRPRGIDVATLGPFQATLTDPRGLGPCSGGLEMIRTGEIGVGYKANVTGNTAAGNVPQGNYNVKVPCPGYQPKVVPTTVPKEGTKLNIPLEPPAPPQPQPGPAPAERVASVRLVGPGLTGFLSAGTQMKFTAIPLDASGRPIRGVACRYRGFNPPGVSVITVEENTGSVTVGQGSGAARIDAVCGTAEIPSNARLISTGPASPSPTPTPVPPPPVVAAPVANFTWTPASPSANQSVQFTDTSTGLPTSWLWDFGDGANSTSSSPTHTYSTAGTYTVSLTATNAGGSNTTTKSLTVSAPPPQSLAFAITSATCRLTRTNTGAGNNEYQIDIAGTASGPANAVLSLPGLSGYTNHSWTSSWGDGKSDVVSRGASQPATTNWTASIGHDYIPGSSVTLSGYARNSENTQRIPDQRTLTCR